MKGFLFFCRDDLFLPIFIFVCVVFPSFGQGSLSSSNVDSFLVRKALQSTVLVSLSENHNSYNLETIGFIAKDAKGNIGVITSFSAIDMAFSIGVGQDIVVYNNSHRVFSLKGVIKTFPVDNLIFLQMDGDLTEQGKRPPLLIADLHAKDQKLFYTIMPVAPYSKWFSAKPVQEVLSFSGRQDFITDTTFGTDFLSESNSLIINEKGEVVSLTSYSSANTLCGNRNMKKILNTPPGQCSFFLKGCIISARKTLYKKAKSGNARAQYELIVRTSADFEEFTTFMSSIGINNPSKIKKSWIVFWKGASKWNVELHYFWLLADTNMTEKERMKYLKILVQNSTIKFLANKSHPHFQYLLGEIYYSLNDIDESQKWFKKASKRDYIPALFRNNMTKILLSITALKILLGVNHNLTYQFMNLFFRDYKTAENFLKEQKRFTHSSRKSMEQYLSQLNEGSVNPINPPPVSKTKKQRRTLNASNELFFRSLNNLKAGFDGINKLAHNGHYPATAVQDVFERLIKPIFLEKTGTYGSVPGEESDKNCNTAFLTPF